MSTHKSIRNSENAVHETQNHHLVGTYRLGEKYINILNEKSYIATISLPILYRRAVFALQNPPFWGLKVPILYNSLIISTYEIEKRKRVTIWLLLKFPGLP